MMWSDNNNRLVFAVARVHLFTVAQAASHTGGGVRSSRLPLLTRPLSALSLDTDLQVVYDLAGPASNHVTFAVDRP